MPSEIRQKYAYQFLRNYLGKRKLQNIEVGRDIIGANAYYSYDRNKILWKFGIDKKDSEKLNFMPFSIMLRHEFDHSQQMTNKTAKTISNLSQGDYPLWVELIGLYDAALSVSIDRKAREDRGLDPDRDKDGNFLYQQVLTFPSGYKMKIIDLAKMAEMANISPDNPHPPDANQLLSYGVSSGFLPKILYGKSWTQNQQRSVRGEQLPQEEIEQLFNNAMQKLEKFYIDAGFSPQEAKEAVDKIKVQGPQKWYQGHQKTRSLLLRSQMVDAKHGAFWESTSPHT